MWDTSIHMLMTMKTMIMMMMMITTIITNRQNALSHLFLYCCSWSVNTIPGILLFDLRNLWKEAGGRGIGCCTGSLMSTLYLLPDSLRIFNISFTYKIPETYVYINYQCTKMLTSDSHGLVDFAFGLVDFILHLPIGEVKVLGKSFLR